MTTFTAAEANWDLHCDDETPTAKLVRNLFAIIARGLEDAGMPLTAEQEAFFRDGIEQVSR